MEDYLTDDRNNNSPARKEILLFYFEILHYQEIKDKRDENYVNYIQHEEGGGFFVKLFCVNPAKNLREYMQRGRASILFSATLLPIAYHRELLGANPDDYDVYARSVFNPEKMGLFIASDVTSKYSRRSDEEYQNIARYLREIVGNRHGNYLAFFPSHRFLREVYGRYMELYHDGQSVDCLVQEERMDEEKREGFLQRFASDERSEDRSLLGFCVSGGIFGEGIDLKNDSLIGAIIVGTCLPQVCPEREIVKAYFDEQGGDGFDYAYKFPGVNKVLQAAGRVIRTQEDIGIVALLDERFLQTGYRRLFPREWENTEVVKVDEIAKRVEKFWNDWLF
jgi:Rad3-related DNA helicase